MLSLQDIELGFERYLELLMRDERVAREFEQSRAEFFAEPLAARVANAERRHLEWFLLERPSAELAAVPAQAWQEEWRASLAGAPAELATSLAQSLAGAFEVTSLTPGEGLWVRDLFTLGEHPILEARASLSIQVGDLLVGRLFPAGGGAFLLSPAASVFRSPDLLEAVRVDLQAMRSARRGVLRVQQLELEHLFHGPGALQSAPASSEEALERAEKGLRDLGIAPAEVARALKQVRRGMRAGDASVLTDILNRLAFETGVDLAAARLVLAELWELVAQREPSAKPASSDAAEDARAALAAFDRGRAQGKDLEQLFRELERDLGVDEVDDPDEEPPEDDAAGAPDFPGVVGAMVEEFPGELGGEEGAERARRFERLREFGTYAQDVGVFDDLGSARLVDFSARWVLDEGRLATPEEAQALLDALAAFCRWCEERHGVPLWKDFEPTLARLRSSLPRHLVLRRHASPGAGQGASRVVRVADRSALLRDLSGNELAVELTDVQAEHLRAGDLVRVGTRAGAPALGPSYPPELAEALAPE